jgi:hypothetical protein
MTDPKTPSERDSKRDEPQEQEAKWYERTPYQVLLFAVGIALFVLIGGLILNWYINPHTSGQKKDLVQALGLITAGVAGAVGIFFTWRGQHQTREAQEENQRNTQALLRHAQEELSLTRQGQITERFTRAVEQLGQRQDGPRGAEQRPGRGGKGDDAPRAHLTVVAPRDSLKGRAGRLVARYSQSVGKEGNSANSASGRDSPNVSFGPLNVVA